MYECCAFAAQSCYSRMKIDRSATPARLISGCWPPNVTRPFMIQYNLILFRLVWFWLSLYFIVYNLMFLLPMGRVACRSRTSKVLISGLPLHLRFDNIEPLLLQYGNVEQCDKANVRDGNTQAVYITYESPEQAQQWVTNGFWTTACFVLHFVNVFWCYCMLGCGFNSNSLTTHTCTKGNLRP